MARISTYTNAIPVTLSDKFIGTEVAGTPANVTKNFLVSDLLTLFQSNITLQNVLDAGNTATQSITLTGNISLNGGNLTLGSTASLYVGGLLIDSTGATGALGQTLTSDASGNPVWGSGGGGSQNLEQVLAVGNTATNNINLTGNLTQTGNITLTGDYGQMGTMRLTGGMVHAGSYQYSAGQFTMTASGTMVLGGALTCNSSVSLTGTVKDYTDTLGAANQFLVSNASGQVTWQSTLPSPLASSALTVINLALSNAEGVVVTTAALITDVRIPTNAGQAFPIGTKVTIIQEGAGQVTIAPTAGVTLNSEGGKTKTTAQYSVAHVVKTATDTWYAYGDITT